VKYRQLRVGIDAGRLRFTLDDLTPPTLPQGASSRI
jgi:hypothetical protein